MKTYIIFLLILLFTACGGRKTQKPAEEKPILTVSIEPLRYFAESIAGEHFHIISMVPEGSSPETYSTTIGRTEPKPRLPACRIHRL